jgi:hypothetical protein
MKEFDLTNSEALDAGWDVGEEKGPAVSVAQPKTAFSTETVADEFDAAWDSTPLTAPPPSAIVDTPARIAPVVPQQPTNSGTALRALTEKRAQQTTDGTPPLAHQLTKKERRDIERQQRLHAAKKQAQSKSEKKRHRMQVATTEREPVTQAPRDPVPGAAASPLSGVTKPRHKAKPRAEQRRPQSADAKTQVQRTVTTESRRPKPNQAQAPAAVAAIGPVSQEGQKKSQLPMYVTIGLVLMSLALLWHFAGRR